MRYHSLPHIRNDLDSGKLSLPDLVRYYLKNIESNDHLNAFLSVYRDESLERASAIQSKLANGSVGKLAGMVLGIKDVLCYKDHPLQCASRILDGFTSSFNATAIQRLIDEDVIVIGRLNCDEFGMGSTNENSAFGPVKNPLDHSLVPGGSSGGSAVAVAADMCLAALGTDTGGSVRQPASFCGVIGLKPTYSRISRYGLVAYASSFDTIGTLSRSVEDSAILLEVMAGYDEMDSTSSRQSVDSYTKFTPVPGKLKIGVINRSVQDSIDQNICSALDSLTDHLLSEDHLVSEINFPELEYVLPTYYILTAAEASTNLSRYDGVRYGPRVGNGDLESMYKSSRSDGFGEEVRRRIMLGTFVLSASYYDAYYTKAQKVRRIIQDKTDRLFETYDLIITPTAPTLPFRIGHCQSPLEMYLADLFTVQASVTGIPAISLPVSRTKDGLPVGVQVMSRAYTEDKLLSFSKYLLNDAIITA